MEDEVKNTEPLMPSPATIGIGELDTKVARLEKSKKIRGGITVVGITLTVLWIIGAIGASADSAANPASVSVLGPILAIPFLLLGITLIIVGVAGRTMIGRQLDDAKRTRDTLIASLTNPDEDEKPIVSEVN